MCIYMSTYLCTYIHTYTRTYIHTYINIHYVPTYLHTTYLHPTYKQTNKLYNFTYIYILFHIPPSAGRSPDPPPAPPVQNNTEQSDQLLT